MRIKVEFPHRIAKVAIVLIFQLKWGNESAFISLVFFFNGTGSFYMDVEQKPIHRLSSLLFLLSTLRSSKTMNAIPTSEEEVDLLWSIRGLQKTTDNFFLCTNVKLWKIIKPVL